MAYIDYLPIGSKYLKNSYLSYQDRDRSTDQLFMKKSKHSKL